MCNYLNLCVSYFMSASVVGFYSLPFFHRLKPSLHDTPMTKIIGNCGTLLIMSSALPVLSRTLGTYSIACHMSVYLRNMTPTQAWPGLWFNIRPWLFGTCSFSPRQRLDESDILREKLRYKQSLEQNPNIPVELPLKQSNKILVFSTVPRHSS